MAVFPSSLTEVLKEEIAVDLNSGIDLLLVLRFVTSGELVINRIFQSDLGRIMQS